jgi:hypothetical protein
VPRGVADFVTKVLKGDQVLVNPDHLLREAYEKRTADRPEAAAAPPAVPAPAETTVEPEKEAV